METYDIFISYRRDGGFETARLLYDALQRKGYRVFLDLSTLRSGDFNQELYRTVDNCTDFLLVLSQHSLDRCADQNDWVRQEIAHAVSRDKNVIPVICQGFSFPEQLPEDIAALRYRNGVELTPQYFDAAMDRLTAQFLHSKPVNAQKRKRHAALIIAAVVMTVLVLAAGGLLALRGLLLRDGNNSGSNSQAASGASVPGQTAASRAGQADSALCVTDLGCSSSDVWNYGGVVDWDGECSFFDDPDRNLYRIPYSTQNECFLVTDKVFVRENTRYLNKGGDCLYYAAGIGSSLRTVERCNKDGSDITVLLSNSQSEYLFLQYAMLSDGSEMLYYLLNRGIYCYDIASGKETLLISDNAWWFCLYGDSILYLGGSTENELKRTTLTGGDVQSLGSGFYDYNGGFLADNLLYLVPASGSAPRVFNTDGSRAGSFDMTDSLNMDPGLAFACVGSRLYYVNASDGCLHRVQTDGTCDEVVLINCLANWISGDNWLWVEYSYYDQEYRYYDVLFTSADGSDFIYWN